MAIRAMATATVTWGLVSIPMKLYLAAESRTGVSFASVAYSTNTKDAPLARLKQKLWNPIDDVEVEHKDVRKGFEVARGQYVVFTDEELEQLRPASDKVIDVKEFVPVDSIGDLFVEKVYYLGVDKGGDKGYVLLQEILAERGVCAIAQWHNRGREHLVAIAAFGDGLVMRQLRYKDEVRDQTEVTDMVARVTVSDPERAMARQLVDQLTSPAFDPAAYVDSFAARVREAAEAKAVGSAVLVQEAAPRATIVDLFEALKRSVDQGKAATSPSGGAAPATTPRGPAKTKRAARAKKTARG